MPTENSFIFDSIERRDFIKNYLYRYLDSVGDGSGIIDMATTTDAYFLSPASNQRFIIYNLIISYSDNSLFSTGFYGSDLTLTNGIIIDKVDTADASIVSLVDSQAITTNAHWTRMTGQIPKLLTLDSNDHHLMINWDLTANGIPLTIDGHLGESLKFNVRDNFSNLTGHFVFAKGIII